MAGNSGGKAPAKKMATKRSGSPRLTQADRAEIASMEEQCEELAAMDGGGGGLARGAGLPTGGGSLTGRTMLALQKFRVDWFSLPRKSLFEVACVLAERHWFVRPVVNLNVDLYGVGFRFSAAGAEYMKARDASYNFSKVARDLMLEWKTCDNVVAIWRKTSSGTDALPEVWVPDCKDAEVLPGGRLKIRFNKHPHLKEEQKDFYGDLFDKMQRGLIGEIGPDDEHWAFRVLTSGKSSSGLLAPSLTGILDDLDFVEGAKIGDWNGVWQRRKMLLHVTKGYAVSSGSNAGRTTNNAKREVLQVVANWLKTLTGSASLATNFDQEFKHVVFPGEFFNAEITKQVWERLLLWSGFAGVLLFKAEAQIAGVSPYLIQQLRAKVLGEREIWIPFIESIFASEDFLGEKPGVELGVRYGNSHLYSVDELTKLVTTHSTYCTMAPQSVREDLLDLDNEKESRLVKEALADKEGYTAVFEPRQGMAAGGVASSAKSDGGDGEPGPGAPKTAAV